jgi:hypothetical protein
LDQSRQRIACLTWRSDTAPSFHYPIPEGGSQQLAQVSYMYTSVHRFFTTQLVTVRTQCHVKHHVNISNGDISSSPSISIQQATHENNHQ